MKVTTPIKPKILATNEIENKIGKLMIEIEVLRDELQKKGNEINQLLKSVKNEII